MSRTKASPGILAILAAFRDSEDCDGDPSRPMADPSPTLACGGDLARMLAAGTIRRLQGQPWQTIEYVKLTDSGLALFREAFPDHPYTLDHAASEREAKDRREYLANIVVHVIPGGHLSPNSAAEQFGRDHFEGHIRTVESLAGDWSAPAWGQWSFSGVVTLAEDDDYRQSRYRIAFNRTTQTWEFRANLD